MIKSNIKWSKEEWFYLSILIGLGSLMILTGLSVRSLWGPESRWAVIAREMLESGNYFMPTINGRLYFDKPLLYYWTIILFSIKSGVTEMTARLPGALAGICSCMIVFFTGRRLFDSKTGFISGMLLLTTFMFLFWARHASADMMNLLFIWLMLWLFIEGGIEGHLKYLITFYSIGAIASFVKGPVGPAVAIFSICFYSMMNFLMNIHKKNPSYDFLKEEFFKQFKWIVSLKGLISFFTGWTIFLILLFIPVWRTDSWEHVRLMWRENVVRFFIPFDHKLPAYAYIKYFAVYIAPWTLLIVASFFKIKKLWNEWSIRYITLISAGILIFFLLSGSRRSYYILPLIPGLIIITGKVIRDWLDGYSSYILKTALISTAILISFFGLVLLYIYIKADDFNHISLIILSLFVLFFGILSVFFFYRKKEIKGFILLFLIIICTETWVFNFGMSLMERQRGSIKLFSMEVKDFIKPAEKEKVAILNDVPTSFIFYLNMGKINEIHSKEDLIMFRKRHPDGMVIADIKKLYAYYNKEEKTYFEPIIVEKKKKEKGPKLALLRFK